MHRDCKKILYLSYNGMTEALGASQVLSYIYKLSDKYEFHIIAMEKEYADSDKINNLKAELAKSNIKYYPVIYKTSSIQKPLNFIRFLNKAYKVVRQHKIKFIHCRSYLPAIAARIIQRTQNVKYLFDTRGFEFDERADVGAITRNGIIYKVLKKIEKSLYNHASAVNMLSHESKRFIESNGLFNRSQNVKPITVITTCVDLDRFKIEEKVFKEPITIGYVGNTIGWYDFDKTLKVIKAIGKVIDYKFIIYNGNQHDFIKSKLNEHNIPTSKVHIESVEFSEMPDKLKDIDLSVFFIRPLFSKKASAATKLGELLASGIPVITNDGVGDHKFYVEDNQTGLIVNTDKLEQYDFKTLIPKIVNRETSLQCRCIAEEYFSGDKGAQAYHELYEQIFID